jgi:phospholipase/lecithinase/hemolysin
MHTSPATYGLTASPITKTCFDSTTGGVCTDPKTHLYFDTLHPVTSVHRIMAQKMNALVRAH